VNLHPSMPPGQRRYTLLDEAASLVLRALALRGPDAVDAFRRWRTLVKLDDAGKAASRVLPLFIDLAQREGIDDPDLQRMQGVGRHIWTQNTVNVRLVLAAVDALAAGGIRPMLLKGMALFVRAPDFMRKRASADGDILVPAVDLQRAAALLRGSMFSPAGHRWEDFGPPLVESDSSGVSLQLSGIRSQLDIHWRPLPDLTDPAFAEDLFARAELHELHGRTVLLPSASDQLFLCIARCEPWDGDECLTRLVEAHLLLSTCPDKVDWPSLAALIQRYGLDTLAFSFLSDLSENADVTLPEGYLEQIRAGISSEKSREWQIRTLAPLQRSMGQTMHLLRADEVSGRRAGGGGLPYPFEFRLRQLGLNSANSGLLWRALRRRLRPQIAMEASFLEGFSAPEIDGRWTVGPWSALAVPLTPAQQAGEPVRLNVDAFGLGTSRIRIGATGGRETLSHVQAPADPKLRLELRVKPLPELGGGGLILLWHPDARSPSGTGVSSDERQLGLFFRRPWGLPGHRPPSGAAALYRVLRQTYRRLPLPLAVRSRLSPALGILQQQLASRTLPPPLPIAFIKPGDVVVSAFLTDQSGIARAGRLTRDSLRTWGVRVVEHDITADPTAELVPDLAPGGVWVCHCNPPEASMEALVAETERLWASRYRIGVWAYELQRLPATWPPMLKHFHEIWAPSAFVADAIRNSSGPGGPLVRVVPHPMPLPPIARPLAGPHRPFTFLTMFDARSTAARKNPMGAITAFQRALCPARPRPPSW